MVLMFFSLRRSQSFTESPAAVARKYPFSEKEMLVTGALALVSNLATFCTSESMVAESKIAESVTAAVSSKHETA